MMCNKLAISLSPTSKIRLLDECNKENKLALVRKIKTCSSGSMTCILIWRVIDAIQTLATTYIKWPADTMMTKQVLPTQQVSQGTKDGGAVSKSPRC